MTMPKKRAILLEDNEMVKKILSGILNKYGYEVFHFETPAICPLQLYPDCRCGENARCADIIISDLEMPLVDGLTFIKNQKIKECKAPYVAMMSGAWGEQDLLRAKEYGCKIFSKPLNLSDFYNWLDEIENEINLDRQLSNWFNESTDKVLSDA